MRIEKIDNLRHYVFKYLFILIGILPLTSCSEPAGLYGVSVVHLLANPENYIGEDVIFTGYLDTGEFHRYAIFMSKQDAEIRNKAASIPLWDISKNIKDTNAYKYYNCFVSVKGRFDIDPVTHFAGIVGQPKIWLETWEGDDCATKAKSGSQE